MQPLWKTDDPKEEISLEEALEVCRKILEKHEAYVKEIEEGEEVVDSC